MNACVNACVLALMRARIYKIVDIERALMHAIIDKIVDFLHIWERTFTCSASAKFRAAAVTLIRTPLGVMPGTAACIESLSGPAELRGSVGSPSFLITSARMLPHACCADLALTVLKCRYRFK